MGGCFVAGTPVRVRDGLKPIEDIRIGDWVLSQPEMSGEVGFRRVVDTFVVGERQIFEVSFRDGAGRVERLEATPKHPFWVKGKGWIGVEDLGVGDRLELHDRSEVEIVVVVDTGRIEPVFNFAVDGYHTYYVGEMGVWVHNASWSAARASA